jgi:hypothetical protein
MTPYASVIVPTHDRLGTLAGAIASIRRQSVENIEILIIGDGPTPEVSATAEALVKHDHRIRFLRFDKSPGDAGRNCNRGVHEAQSERIFYSDDDDVWLPHHVETIGPNLDHSHIVDTLPVSVGAVSLGNTQFHGTIVNSGNARTRTLLAEDRLKLIFDTHVAHLKSSYLGLGNPWIAPRGYSVCHMLSAFASAPHIRWTTSPKLTALSLHGTARMTVTPSDRHSEIESLLNRSQSWTSDAMFARTDFTWHLLRTLYAEPPAAEDTVATYLARFGIAWDEPEGPAGDAGVLLAVPLREQHRRAIEFVFASFQGRAAVLDGRPETNKTFGDVLSHMLDRVLSSFVSLEFALAMLQPFGWERAWELVQQIQGQSPETGPLFALLNARLLLILGRIIPARAIADRLCQDAPLSDHELTRLLVHIDLAEGRADVAIQRMEQAWLAAPKFFEIGLQLAQILIAADRTDRAVSVCKTLEGQIPGHPTLVSISRSMQD